MSTHKHLDKICLGAALLAVVLCVLFLNAETLGIQPASREMGYESRLFDTTQVHTIDIVMDDWDSFLETCENEEYAVCSVVIDGETYTNVGIRAKGNTSLSTVSSMNSDRYSFKIEFDQYDSTKSYHGLDKLSLNNLIQDSTMMKDYLTYQLMDQFGAASPLCSYVYITVNGEDWGLYLAVEAVEDSFLQRNYGNDYGELYKPDSMNMGGGGPGKGQDFNMEDFMNANPEEFFQGGQETAGDAQTSSQNQRPSGGMPGGWGGGNMGNGTWPTQGNWSEMPMQIPSDMAPQSGGSFPTDAFPEFSADPSAGQPVQTIPEGTFPTEGSFPSNGAFPQMPDGTAFPDFSGTEGETSASPTMPDMGGQGGEMPDFSFGGFGGFGGGETKLQYSDDDPASYSTIFSSAKTTVSETDQKRLIQSLKTLSEGENIESVVDIDQVLRYFVVHNFVVNSDSYTGAMVHNYYLYEEDGVLSMIPWDYNLAYGTFQGGNASSAVNDPIDSPLSVSGNGDRPMADWIFRSEEYTQLYHQYFAQFLENTDFAAIIDETAQLIAPYVEKDPTKFYTYEEFEQGVDTIREFCLLRAQSVQGQLDGTIPSTDAGQSADSSTQVDASHITLSDMGSMGGGMGGGRGDIPQGTGGQTGDNAQNMPSFDNFPFQNMPGFDQTQSTPGTEPTDTEQTVTDPSANRPNRNETSSDKAEPASRNEPSGTQMPIGNWEGRGDGTQQASQSSSPLVLTGVSVLVLLLGLVAVKLYRRT